MGGAGKERSRKGKNRTYLLAENLHHLVLVVVVWIRLAELHGSLERDVVKSLGDASQLIARHTQPQKEPLEFRIALLQVDGLVEKLRVDLGEDGVVRVGSDVVVLF